MSNKGIHDYEGLERMLEYNSSAGDACRNANISTEALKSGVVEEMMTVVETAARGGALQATAQSILAKLGGSDD